MTETNTSRPAEPRARTSFYSLLLRTASLLALSAFALAAPANAQDQASETPAEEEIVVTGIRASLESAQSIKREAGEFVDSITAVDIGRLPDVNVAEALQRIPGIQITRSRGEGSTVAIRGLTSVRTEMNGRDTFSTVDGRALSLEDIPSELLAGVDVYKNPSAAVIEGGVGGAINFRTRMPFDFNERTLSASAGATYYDLREKWGGAASALYSDRWTTPAGEFGALINVSYAESYFREDDITVEPFFERTDIPGFLGAPVQVAAGGGMASWNGDRTRTGAALGLQWRPSDNLEFYLQGFAYRYEFYDPQTGMFGFGPDNSGGSLTPAPGVDFEFDSEGNMLYGAFAGGQFYQSFARDDERLSETADIAIGAVWDITDSLTARTDLQYVDSFTKNESVTGFGGLNFQPTLFVDLRGDLPLFTLEPTSTLADPANYTYQALMVRSARSVGDQLAWRGDLEWDFDDDSWGRSLSVGARATSRDIETRESGFDWSAITGPPWDGSPAATVLFSEFPEYYAPSPHIGDLFRGDGAGIWGPHFIVDPALLAAGRRRAIAILGGLNLLSGAPTDFTPQDQINTQHEETYAGHVMLKFGAEGASYDGNVGIRIVQTQLSADGVQTLTYRTDAAPNTAITVFSPITSEQDYAEILPSLNLRFFLSDDLYLRFAVARGLSRPSFGDLAANFALTENYIDHDNDETTPPVLGSRTGSGGNPGLRPLTSNQADIALEWYPSDTTMLYGTVFYKKVYDFTQNGVFFENFEIPGKGSQPFEITSRVNGEEGTIRGFEIGGNTFFDFLPDPFNSFGVQANYTYVDSEAPSPFAVDSGGRPLIVPIEFLSENSFNLVGFYSRGPINARLAYNWRDQYVITTAGTGTGQLPIYQDAFGQLDASVSYDFNDRISLVIEGANLLDTERRSFQAVENRPRDFLLNDRRIGFRLRLRN